MFQMSCLADQWGRHHNTVCRACGRLVCTVENKIIASLCWQAPELYTGCVGQHSEVIMVVVCGIITRIILKLIILTNIKLLLPVLNLDVIS